MLHGYSASFQGQPERADSCFEEAIAVEVPPLTYSPNKPLEARRIRRSNHIRAFRILGDHIQELLQADNMHAVARLHRVRQHDDRHRQINRSRPHRDVPGDHRSPRRPHMADLISESVRSLTETGHLPEPFAVGLNHRQALEYMRDVLERLVETQSATV